MKFHTRISAMSLLLAIGGGSAMAQEADYPPDAQAGQCFARVLVPEVTEVVAEQVVDQPERQEIKVVAAQYETVTETIIVKEQTVIYENVPATYKTVTEQVMVEPERTETVVIPAKMETYEEKVLVREAYTTWKPGAGLFGRGAAGMGNATPAAAGGQTMQTATGELLCKVEVPAEYKMVKRTRVAVPETTSTKVIPARYETRTRQVIETPARVVEKIVPAVTDTVKVRKMVSPAREDVIIIPATYKTVEKRVVKGGGGVEWREVLCNTNASSSQIMRVQQALTLKGYPTTPDGVFGPGTLRAMEAYQRANGLPVGYLTMSTVESLGVSR